MKTQKNETLRWLLDNSPVINNNNFVNTNALNARVFPITFISAELENAGSSGVLRSNCQVYLSSYFSFNSIGRILPTFIGDERYKHVYDHGKRNLILQKFLQSSASDYIGEEDLIFFSDGMDVMFYDDLQRAAYVYVKYLREEGIDVERDRDMDWPLLFNAEKNRHPPPYELKNYIKNMDVKLVISTYVNRENYPKKSYCHPQSTFKFLNSGMYIGRKRDIKSYIFKIFHHVVINPTNIHNDDQGIAHYVYISKSFYPIAVDCNTTLGLPTFEACESFTFDQRTGKCQISSPLNKERPIAVHSVGKGCPQFCPCLKSIIDSGLLQFNIQRAIHSHGYSNEKELKKEFGVVVYNSDYDTIRIQSVLDFCGKDILFNIPKHRCVFKAYQI
ncbi:hypothetical protein FDP41_000280 [Naegleria fowleri]|uniref:Uncharacterized protein n=1 Tax=Naegleria fowleri TaxID=5763 RepID=A0A6A5CAU3_NAEFO|nr:uncharacterized protein FDP41_000280 [Naegleria fowleri]KAF0984381.1 hypothetical protein FDP41_000280 [Naegleria fowleri]